MYVWLYVICVKLDIDLGIDIVVDEDEDMDFDIDDGYRCEYCLRLTARLWYVFFGEFKWTNQQS